jgi:hypothetical protein
MALTQSQIVYVLTNPAMPGLVKIGMTTKIEVVDRMRQLYGTGVPVPFDCAFACQVNDAAEVESALHFAFGMTRINPNREFFKIEPERVIAVLRLLKVDEVTDQFEQALEADVPQLDIQSAKELKKSRRPTMNFKELDIPVGAVLVFADRPSVTATVLSERKVDYQGEECSLTSATRKVLGLADDYPLQPSPYWMYNNKTVREIYEAFHNGGTES